MRGKILLIDDDDNVRESVALFLEELGLEIVHTNNGTRAVPLIFEFKPDVVFCDFVMPHMSGMMVLKQIKDAYPHQKVIMMSGLHEGGAVQQALDLGAEDFLTKPVSMQDLEKLIDKLFPAAKG